MKMTPSLAGAYSGSVGGLTASHNKGGAYFRRRSVPTDPGSPFQVNVRSVLASLAEYWRNTLTAAERVAWDTYAANVSWIDTLGQTMFLSGINHFVRSNVPRLQNNIFFGEGYDAFSAATALVEAAPTTFNLGDAAVVSVLDLEVGGGESNLSVGVGTRPATSDLLVYASAPQDPSINFFKGPYVMVGSLAGVAVTTVSANLASSDITPYATRYAAPAVGQRVFGFVRVTQDDGRLTGMTRFMVDAVAAP